MPLHPRLNDDDVSVVLATTNFPNPPMTLDEKREEQTAAHRLIHAKYDAGIPFFTKDLFRDVVRQLESDNSIGQRVSVTGIDGLAVHFDIETGREYTSHPYGDDHICIITKPRFDYQTIQSLLAIQDPTYHSVYRSYLPVEVVHSTEVRNAATNELVDLWPTSDYATVKPRFEEARRSLGASEHFAQVKATLTSVAVPPGIDKVIALACSTMTWSDDGFLPSMAQHALALTIRDLLGHTPGTHGEAAGGVRCYAQDPIYTPVDEQVLSEAGFTVLNDPRAFLEVDEASVVIAISPDIPVRQIIADIARPAIMVWDKVTISDPNVSWQVTDPVSPRVIQMMKEYTELPFPPEDEYFGDLAIYIRKAG